ncbi:tyrosine-type recombinase/integrase [Paraburkholderia gardini]|uniref:tyrosine-type recombinase/integrase n=1 Tax=Paraburkholderia gardini TaxID=2823469 RepID=UPI001DB7B5A5|nr:integrase arm-type DNA-binding domain-containing protein [Paraburkholderia gardini]CAG4924712.1 Prophage integrase IntS [Paraburkholderia gardini]
MATNLLSPLEVKNAHSQGKAIRKLKDGDGLYLWVYADGSKYWRIRYWITGKEKSLSLGVSPKVTLADARKRRAEIHDQLQQGLDPGSERKAAKAAAVLSSANTFEAVAREWYGKQVGTWAESHAVDVKRRLERNIYPTLGARPIADLTPPEVLAAIRKIENRGATDLAHRVMGVVGQVLRYGIATGRGERDHTADLRGALTPHVKSHQPAVKEKALPQLLRDISQYDQAPTNGDKQTRLALQLLALTFVRTSELIGATWEEMTLPENPDDGGIWSIPGARMKSGKDHLVPLAPQAVRALNELKILAGDSKWVLPGRNPSKPISNNTLLFALYRLGYRGKMTGHGFRAVASTALNESNLFDPDWIERQLAHVPANQVAAAYNRALYLPHRKKMMAWWSEYLDTAIKTV